MFSRTCALLGALGLQATACYAGEVERLNINDLTAGSRFEISTADRYLRGDVVDPATGETRMSASWDGIEYTEPKTVFLLGATQGRYAQAGGLMLVKMNQVQNGLGLELGVGSLDGADRLVTAPVHSIRVE